MAIITDVGGTELRTGRLAPDALGDALRITRGKNQTSDSSTNNLGFHRFD